MDVFVYGTLTEPERVGELLESFAFVGPARLEGLRVVEGRYPTLALPVADGGDAGVRSDERRPGGDADATSGRRSAEVDATVGGDSSGPTRSRRSTRTRGSPKASTPESRSP